MNIFLLITLVGFSLLGCKRSGSPQEVERLIADNCAQNPVNFLRQEEESGQRLYLFGPEDAAFRQQLRSLKAHFQKTGIDLSGEEKLRFVRSYLPKYVASCQAFFHPIVRECAAHPLHTATFQNCVTPRNTAYREHLRKQLRPNAEGLVDLESLGHP
jgi:hypothetical protein